MISNADVRREMSYGIGPAKRLQDMQFKIRVIEPEPEIIEPVHDLLDGIVICMPSDAAEPQ